MSKMFSRAGRAALLDRKPFTEAFFDSDATADGAIMVSTVAAVAYFIRLLIYGSLSSFSLTGLLRVVIAAVVSWLILGFATWLAATKLFSGSGRPQTMLALQGLAVLPLILESFGSIASTIGLVWYLVVLVVGTREAVELKNRDAAVSVLIGFAAAVVIRALLSAPFAAFNALFG